MDCFFDNPVSVQPNAQLTETNESHVVYVHTLLAHSVHTVANKLRYRSLQQLLRYLL